ncbi:NTP transferase domain-containing protein [Pararhizobium haloflavum]|uniref:NTP transferase domain-containing protein n=1 Tax=Pararhizobium haloflavum TaxID=2037914 RepID=UPI000C18BBBF|nr:molybdopterin-binding/glycosyltransferase family 2 protein [Pararhizobium haloflavum]
MRFGEIAAEQCDGAILAHSLSVGGERFKKGRVLTARDGEALRTAGIKSVIALVLDPGDETEDVAAARLGDALAGAGVTIGEAATGRVNIHAAHNGLFRVDKDGVDALNRIDPAITFACLRDRVQVREGDMVATIKIIPLAVSGAALAEATMAIARPGLLEVKPFAPRRVGLVATKLASLKPSVMDKTRDLLQVRLDQSGSEVIGETRVAHDPAAVADALLALKSRCDMLIVFGASAVADAQDVIPAAILRAGGTVEAVGMPVDPGNLLVLGELGGVPVIGAPGCARSPKENGFDWVLARILAGEAVTGEDITGMGVGGLLMEIPTRPQPRSGHGKTDRPIRIETILMAAGRARRMGEGGPHKLLAEFDGIPLVRRAAMAALEMEATPVSVVTGHRRAEIYEALAGLDCSEVFNPDFADGMASSLQAGIRALKDRTDGALVLLADMPAIKPEHLRLMAEAFREGGGRAVVRAVTGGKRGNPVILPRAAFPAILTLEGDVGARQIVESGAYPIIDVDIGEAAARDVDTPEAVRAAGGVLKA